MPSVEKPVWHEGKKEEDALKEWRSRKWERHARKGPVRMIFSKGGG